jgi:hypothetical protein
MGRIDRAGIGQLPRLSTRVPETLWVQEDVLASPGQIPMVRLPTYLARGIPDLVARKGSAQPLNVGQGDGRA